MAGSTGLNVLDQKGTSAFVFTDKHLNNYNPKKIDQLTAVYL